jgi:hypothetical protein
MGFVLQLHSIWRWVLLVAAAIVVLKSLIGWLGKRPFTKLDDQLGLILAWFRLDLHIVHRTLCAIMGHTGILQWRGGRWAHDWIMI